MNDPRYWEGRWRDEYKENERLQQQIARYATALQRIRSLDPKNVEKYAQAIAIEALQ